MKRFLSILATVGISTTGVSNVTACGSDSTKECDSCDRTAARAGLWYLIDFVQQTIDEIDPEMKERLGYTLYLLHSDLVFGQKHYIDDDLSLPQINEWSQKILLDYKNVWLKILECSIEKNKEFTVR